MAQIIFTKGIEKSLPSNPGGQRLVILSPLNVGVHEMFFRTSNLHSSSPEQTGGVTLTEMQNRTTLTFILSPQVVPRDNTLARGNWRIRDAWRAYHYYV